MSEPTAPSGNESGIDWKRKYEEERCKYQEMRRKYQEMRRKRKSAERKIEPLTLG
ncbi:hypothetical protein E4U33_007742, partial [Claviceps sp. LM78 group G4]